MYHSVITIVKRGEAGTQQTIILWWWVWSSNYSMVVGVVKQRMGGVHKRRSEIPGRRSDGSTSCWIFVRFGLPYSALKMTVGLFSILTLSGNGGAILPRSRKL